MEGLDLDLWENEALYRRQSQLKKQFWELLGNLGDRFPQQDLLLVHPTSKGKKLSQGQDLGGLPYQVLDLIRDFDWDHGLNIRLLHWFGKGIFLFLLAGKKTYPTLPWERLEMDPCQTDSPWDYLRILQEKKSTSHSPLPKSYQQGFRKLTLSSDPTKNLEEWTIVLDKLLQELKFHQSR